VDVLLSAPVPGILTAQHFREGDFVKQGQVILELDKRLEELEVLRRKLVVDIRKMDLDATRTLFEKTTSVPKEELAKKEADYRVAVVEYDMAGEQLKRRLVVAPFDGVITQMPLDVGEATEAYQPLIRLVDSRQCRFECNLEASDAVTLRLDQRVRLRLDTGAEPVTVEGTVVFLSPVADKASGLINMKVLFDNASGALRPGLSGQLLLFNSN
jgi:RND family efflux transporter MFP subunit